MKPVAAGAEWADLPDGSMGGWHNEDVDLLTVHSRLKLPVELVSPYLFRTATAPHIAAMQERKIIELAPILDAYASLREKSQALVVEGVGGFRVPFSDTCDSADLAQQLALPVVLVVGIRLGCLNHALLTAEAIAARGLHFAGWVANIVDENMLYPGDNITALSARLSAPLLGCVPRLSPASAALAADCLNFSVLPNWPSPQTLSNERKHV
jgi:dethiobiotin synthetase